MKIHFKGHWGKVALLAPAIALVISGVIIFIKSGDSDLLIALSTTHVVGGLFSTILVLIRDNTAHQRQTEIQERGMVFALGATSHMANKAFDNQIEFSEEYVRELYETKDILARDADTPEALALVTHLAKIRRKYAIWLTDEIEAGLIKFEHALRKLGANARYIEFTTGNPDGEESRALRFDQNSELLQNILGLGQDMDETIAIENLVKKVKMVLRCEDLAKLRNHFIAMSLSSSTTQNLPYPLLQQ